VATENDSKNAIGMLAAHLLTGGMPQLFADIRTNWTAQSVKKATGKDVSKIVPNGFIDKRNSGAGSLDYAVNIFNSVRDGKAHPCQVMEKLRTNAAIQKKHIDEAIDNTTYIGASLTYFPGDGLSSHYRTPGKIPMTAYRYNCVGDLPTCSVIEGETVELPASVADYVSKVTDKAWPESYWVPRGMTSFEYMSKIGPNHDANTFGNIGADMITLNAMLRIPVDFHNVPKEQIFRPTMWDRFGDNDFLVCEKLGPNYI
jgi:L-fucose isomerase